MRRWLIFAGIIIILILLLRSIFFTISEDQLGALTHFGELRRVITEPGLYMKLPEPVETIRKIEKRIQVLDTMPVEYLTHDKKNIIVDCYICWRVDDVETFIKRLSDVANAEIRLKDISASTIGSMLGRQPLSSLISCNPEEMVLDSLMTGVTEQCAEIAAAEFGVEILEIQMKWLNLPEQNKYSVYDRMKAERAMMARKYRAQGESEATRITAEADKERREILAEAYEMAEKIKGEGDAAAMRTYADAYGKDEDFYRLLRTLESYRKFLNEKTTIILSSDSELLKLLEGGMP